MADSVARAVLQDGEQRTSISTASPPRETRSTPASVSDPSNGARISLNTSRPRNTRASRDTSLTRAKFAP
jgi:hypothetical protein